MKRELKVDKLADQKGIKTENRKAHPDEKGTESHQSWVFASYGYESQGPSR